MECYFEIDFCFKLNRKCYQHTSQNIILYHISYFHKEISKKLYESKKKTFSDFLQKYNLMNKMSTLKEIHLMRSVSIIVHLIRNSLRSRFRVSLLRRKLFASCYPKPHIHA